MDDKLNLYYRSLNFQGGAKKKKSIKKKKKEKKSVRR